MAWRQKRRFCISANAVAMKLTLGLGRETDGRWIAEVPEWNVLLYGDSGQEAVRRVLSGGREIVRDRIARGEQPIVARGKNAAGSRMSI
jgi:hypothetical protein